MPEDRILIHESLDVAVVESFIVGQMIAINKTTFMQLIEQFNAMALRLRQLGEDRKPTEQPCFDILGNPLRKGEKLVLRPEQSTMDRAFVEAREELRAIHDTLTETLAAVKRKTPEELDAEVTEELEKARVKE